MEQVQSSALKYHFFLALFNLSLSLSLYMWSKRNYLSDL